MIILSCFFGIIKDKIVTILMVICMICFLSFIIVGFSLDDEIWILATTIVITVMGILSTIQGKAGKLATIGAAFCFLLMTNAVLWGYYGRALKVFVFPLFYLLYPSFAKIVILPFSYFFPCLTWQEAIWATILTFSRFEAKSPFAVLLRIILQRLLPPDKLDALFTKTAEKQGVHINYCCNLSLSML